VGIREWWTGVEHTRADEPGPSDPSTALTIPSRDIAARAVTSRDALGLAAVYRAVEIRAIAAKQISIDAVLVRTGLPPEETPRLLRKPDPECSRSQFIEKTVVSMNLTGNAYWRCVYADREKRELSSLWVMNPNDVTIQVSPLGRVTGYLYRGKELDTRDVKHLSRMRVAGSPYGLGPIQAAQVELRGSIDTAEYGADFLHSGDVPTGILKSDQMLTKDTADAARTQWTESRGGRGGVAVLGQGLDYRQTFLSPKDAQFIESQNWNVTTAARLFGVPGSLMMVALDSRGSSQTYQNVEQDWLGFVRFGLANDLIEIEDAFTDLLPGTQRAKANYEALLRADTKSRYEAHVLSLAWRPANEIRKHEGLGPIPGGDVLRGAAPAPVPNTHEQEQAA
jgi:HK97 family phage portal protein